MKMVYVVQHEVLHEDGTENVKFIGVFGCTERAQAAVEQLSVQAGFRDCQEGFSIDKYEVDAVQWREGFATA